MKNFILLICLTSIGCISLGQSFFNGDLEGEVSHISDLPYGWEAVPFNDPNCFASSPGNATPDLIDINGGISGTVQVGNPYSGNSFVSGRYSIDGNNIYHEGIQQTVTGFEIDSSYTISFYQTNMKQSNANDTSASWSVYVDDSLIGVTHPSSSQLPSGSTTLLWEYREVEFKASSNFHTIKFLPVDDDPILTSYGWNSALRMGIDYIYINEPVFPNPEDQLIMSNVFTPNGDGLNDVFAPVELGGVKTMTTTIFNRWGNVVYETSDIYIMWDGRDLKGKIVSEGTYFWKTECLDVIGNGFVKHGTVSLVK